MNIPLEVEIQWVLTFLLLGGLLFVGLFNIITFLIRRRLKVHYYFGMLCLFYAVWYCAKFLTIDTFTLNDHLNMMLIAIGANRMGVHITLYTIYTLKMGNPIFEKYFKIISNLLLIACLFIPLSIVYTEGLLWTIELFNVVIQVFISYKIVIVMKDFFKDIRVIPAILYFMITIGTVMQFMNNEATRNTIFLAFFMMAIQAIILSLHYNKMIVEVEQSNVTLEIKVKERTANLLEKEKETIQLISSISHDLRTPITVIVGYLGLLEGDKSSLTDEHRKYISTSRVRLSQMEKLTDDLFTLAKVSDRNYTFQLEALDLEGMMERLVPLYQVQAKEKGITLEVHTEEAVFLADEVRFLQVIDNLMINALEYARSSITITAVVEDEKVLFSVADDGKGIDSADIPFVFDRFFKKSKYGSGLGLSNVKELIRRMDGKVGVESKLNMGTKFYFNLPQAKKNET